jgi:hypothetical protein
MKKASGDISCSRDRTIWMTKRLSRDYQNPPEVSTTVPSQRCERGVGLDS